MRQQRGVDRGHAGRRGAAIFGALDQAQPLFQHRQRRIGEARILIVLDRPGERRLGLFGVVVDVAGGQKQRLGGFAVMGALHAAVHQAAWRDASWMDRMSCVRALARDGPTVEQRRPEKLSLTLASLARLFHLAAIRPDKSRGPGTSWHTADTAKPGGQSMATPGDHRDAVDNSDIRVPEACVSSDSGQPAVAPRILPQYRAPRDQTGRMCTGCTRGDPVGPQTDLWPAKPRSTDVGEVPREDQTRAVIGSQTKWAFSGNHVEVSGTCSPPMGISSRRSHAWRERPSSTSRQFIQTALVWR